MCASLANTFVVGKHYRLRGRARAAFYACTRNPRSADAREKRDTDASVQNLQEVGVVNLASRWLDPYVVCPDTCYTYSRNPSSVGGKGDEPGIGNRESGIGGRGFRGLSPCSPVGSVTVTDLR